MQGECDKGKRHRCFWTVFVQHLINNSRQRPPPPIDRQTSPPLNVLIITLIVIHLLVSVTKWWWWQHVQLTTRPLREYLQRQYHSSQVVGKSARHPRLHMMDNPSLFPACRVSLYIQVFLWLAILICFMTQSKYFHLICCGHSRRLTSQSVNRPGPSIPPPPELHVCLVCRHIPADIPERLHPSSNTSALSRQNLCSATFSLHSG